MKLNPASNTDVKMWEFIRENTGRKQDRKEIATLPRLASAFIAGMVITAVLAYLPLITDIFSQNLSHESAVPAPSDTPDLPKSGSSPDDAPGKHHTYELVYAPSQEAIFSG